MISAEEQQVRLLRTKGSAGWPDGCFGPVAVNCNWILITFRAFITHVTRPPVIVTGFDLVYFVEAAGAIICSVEESGLGLEGEAEDIAQTDGIDRGPGEGIVAWDAAIGIVAQNRALKSLGVLSKLAFAGVADGDIEHPIGTESNAPTIMEGDR